MQKNHSDTKPICPQCGTPYIGESTPFNLLISDRHLCDDCYLKRPIIMERSILDDCIVLSLYRYTEDFGSLMYRYKSLGDVSLAPTFLSPVLDYVKDYIGKRPIVCAPSSANRFEQLGFHSLDSILTEAGFNVFIKPLYKIDDWKQTEHHANERAQIGKHIAFRLGSLLPMDVVLFDDIYTTGNTLKSCIRLLRKRQPGIRIRILVIAKVALR